MLPHTEGFLTACEYQSVALADGALGDELFLALHLIMMGCKNYMGHLKNYHEKQNDGLAYRGLHYMSELRMCKLDDYTRVPSPEEIRTIVADCVTANVGFCQLFIEQIVILEKKDVLGERDNRAVLKLIRKLKRRGGASKYAKALRDLLQMPASAVGACHCFHNSELLMQVAMRQFGIALLIVHDDDGISDKWPYQTENYLTECGSGVFLPLTFGLIHVPMDGNLAILRKRCHRLSVTEEMKPCFMGYALGMKDDIRTTNVNLLTGMFSLSYTSFADFLVTPKKKPSTNRALQRLRDYRDGSYWDLKEYRRQWDEYQCYLQDARRAKENQGEKRAAHQEAPNHGGQEPPHQHGTRGASSRARQKPAGQGMHKQGEAEKQEERDVDPIYSIQSYFGATDEAKTINRHWFNELYLKSFPSVPTANDCDGQKHTIENSLKLLGKSLRTEAECLNFFNNSERAELVKERGAWFRTHSGKYFHPDKFNNKVVNEAMRKEAQHRFASVSAALSALLEWDEIALDKKKQTKKALDPAEFDKNYHALYSWESELYVQSCNDFMNFLEFRQPPKQQQTETMTNRNNNNPKRQKK